jgi:hypothetical protein
VVPKATVALEVFRSFNRRLKMGGNTSKEPKREIKWVKPGDLRPHPLNEKLYGCMSLAKDMDAFRGSVKERAILSALHATLDNVIISGHRRNYIALELGLPTVPVEYVQVEDPLEVEALVIAAKGQRQKTLEAGIREFMRLKLIEAERGKQRQVQAPKRRGKTVRQETGGKVKVQENFPGHEGASPRLDRRAIGRQRQACQERCKCHRSHRQSRGGREHQASHTAPGQVDEKH